jgi:hypothetical protein
MMDQTGRIFYSEKSAKYFVYEEIFLLFLLVIQLYKILGMQFTDNGLRVFVVPVLSQNILWFVATAIVLCVLYFAIARRERMILDIHKNFSKVIFGAGKKKILGIDKEILVLLFTELIFAIAIALAIYIYLDPEVDIVPWPFNYITFFVVLIVGLYFFSKTKPFRESVYGESRLKRFAPAKRLFPTRRITNIKTGSIRVGGKKKKSFKKRK